VETKASADPSVREFLDGLDVDHVEADDVGSDAE
jgi:hypothetical protein